jgi:hypothetical protein
MALIAQPILDFSDKDFASLRLRLQGLARSVFPEWTDFNAANFGNLLLEMFAFVGDNTTFYQDAQARENFWPTVTRRISAIRMGRLINFSLPGAFPAGGVARIAIPAPILVDIPIADGLRIISLDPLDPLPFRTVDTATPGQVESGNVAPFALVDGDTLTLKINGTGVQTVTFDTAEFAVIGTASAQEVADAINNDLVGGTAVVSSSGTKVTIRSDAKGTGSTVEIINGSANTIGKLNFPTGIKVGAATAVITIGNTFVDVDVEQAEFIQNEVFESTGGPNQEFLLARVPYVDSSMAVVASDGTYTEIDTFLNVLPTNTQRFVVLVDQNDRAHLRFGNGLDGKIPEGAISVSYKITRGATGNIEAGKLGSIVDAVLDANGSVVSNVVVSNLLRIEGGADRMSVAQARSIAPASLRALSRSITRSDFETHAQEISGVARAVMLTSNEDLAIQENNGVMLVVARGTRLPSGRYKAATPPQTLLDAVLLKVTVEKPPCITFALVVQPAPFELIDVETRVHFANGADKAATALEIVVALQDFFAASLDDGTPNPNIDFGANVLDDQGLSVPEVVWSDIFNAIRDTSGVRKIDEGLDNLLLNTKRQSVVIGLREFPQLNRVTIFDASTGTKLFDQIPV